VEVKSLYADPSSKVEASLERHRERPEFPLIYGSVDVKKVLAHLPDGEAVLAQIVQRLTRSIESAFNSADEQIESTKSILGLPDAGGLLIVANESVEVLSPELILWQLSKMASKTSASGEPRYQNVQMIWLVCETHTLQRTDAPDWRLLPSFIVETRATANHEAVAMALNNLQPAWAKFNGLPIADLGEVPVASLALTPVSAESKSEEAATPRHEHWRRAYRGGPYLRPLSKEDLLSFGANVIEQLEPFFVLKSGAEVPERSVLNESGDCDLLMQKWTHFLEEMQFRCIDMRDLAKHQGRLN
jgi:hypothetical protein